VRRGCRQAGGDAAVTDASPTMLCMLYAVYRGQRVMHRHLYIDRSILAHMHEGRVVHGGACVVHGC
jgi:hypothetical protein